MLEGEDTPVREKPVRPESLATRLWRWLVRLPWLAILSLPLAAAVAAGLYFYGKSGEPDEARFEIAKAGIGLFAIAIIGGAVAAAFRSLDERRQEAGRIDEYRAATAGELWDAYHQIKAVRRELRAAGFDQSAGRLTARQCATFHASMKSLNDAQLRLEKLTRDVTGQRRVFDPSTEHISSRLDAVEGYVNHCIHAWELRGRLVDVGMDLRALISTDNATTTLDATDRAAVQTLVGFLGPSDGERGLSSRVKRSVDVSGSVKEAADLIQALRFGGGRSLRRSLAKDVKAAAQLAAGHSHT